MLFNSLVFLLFFSVLLILYYATRDWSSRKLVLLSGSYIFYAAWNPPFVLLLWFSTLVDWKIAKRMTAMEDRKKRKALLAVSLVANLGLLGFFKYGEFLMENYQALMSLLGVTVQIPEWDIILPVGISFYTFQTLSYTLDVYRKKTAPAKSFLDFALYVTFFPQLVAGPIVRSNDFIPQLDKSKNANHKNISWGISLLTFGLFEKVVLADNFLAPAADKVYAHVGLLNPVDAWTGVMAFTGQIFCDFSGYSICAIGTALCFGFHLPDNFKLPYAAKGFSDFWRRWHISLSTWLKDYLYISLGGNRSGRLRTSLNLMITMLLGGLWHGASWNFVLWGGIHGVLLVLERTAKTLLPTVFVADSLISGALARIFTFLAVSIAWIFFRSTDLTTSFSILQSLFLLDGTGSKMLPSVEIAGVAIVMTGLVGSHWLLANSSVEAVMEKVPRMAFAATLSAMMIALILTQGGDNAFIYFQF